MPREYHWRFKVRSYEGDAWGQVPTSNILRYLEQTAVDASTDAGYGSEYYGAYNSAWVIRRMTLLVHSPARLEDELEASTWVAYFSRIRAGREYRIVRPGTGDMVASAYAEWAYLDRRTMTPIQVPKSVTEEFGAPGSPLGSYEPPEVPRTGEGPEFALEHTARWHEADSLAHVNNAVYADWLDESLRVALERIGWSTRHLKERGLQLRGEYYRIEYRRAAVPGDHVQVATRIEGSEGRLVAVAQRVTGDGGPTIIDASSIHGWQDAEGEPARPPEGWG